MAFGAEFELGKVSEMEKWFKIRCGGFEIFPGRQSIPI